MTRVTISTCISVEEKSEIEREHWKVPELIRMGIQAKKGMPNTLKRVGELETLLAEEKFRNNQLYEKFNIVARRLNTLESLNKK